MLGYYLHVDSRVIVFTVEIFTFLIIALCAKALQNKRGQLCLLWLTFASNAAGFLLKATAIATRNLTWIQGDSFQFLLSAQLGMSTALLLVLWGLVFVNLEKKHAASVITTTALLGSLVYLAETCLVPAELRTLTMDLAVSISPLFFLKSIPLHIQQSLEWRQVKKRLFSKFIGQRILIGMASGAAASIAAAFRVQIPPNSIASFICAIGIAVILGLSWRKLPRYWTIALPMVPLLTSGILFVPSIGAPLVYLSVMAPAVIWLLWMVFSSVQLSDLKGEMGVGCVAITIADRMAFVVARFAVICTFSPSLLSEFAKTNYYAETMLYPSFVIVFSMIIATTFALLLLSSSREKQIMLQEIAENSDSDMALAGKSIAKKYHLTARELDVLLLLAKGHSRPFICKELYIADGTAKTHIRNIYRKTGCSSKEEILSIMNAERKPLG